MTAPLPGPGFSLGNASGHSNADRSAADLGADLDSQESSAAAAGTLPGLGPSRPAIEARSGIGNDTRHDRRRTRPAPWVQGSRTSAAAAAAIEPRAQTLKSRVLSALRAAGSRGLTDDEIAEKTGLGPNTARPRRVELVTAGLVSDSGRTRTAAGGGAATVWVAGAVAHRKVDPANAARGMSETAHEVWCRVEAADGIEARAVAEAMGITPSVVGLILEWLAVRGLVRFDDGAGLWLAPQVPAARVSPSATHPSHAVTFPRRVEPTDSGIFPAATSSADVLALLRKDQK